MLSPRKPAIAAASPNGFGLVSVPWGRSSTCTITSEGEIPRALPRSAEDRARFRRRLQGGISRARDDERAPVVARAEEAMLAGRSVAARDVVLRRPVLPGIEDGLDDAPRPLDLVEPQEGRVVTLEHVEEQRLVRARLALVGARVVGAQHRLPGLEIQPGLLRTHHELGALGRAHAEH